MSIALDRLHQVDVVYTDLTKAFDFVNQRILVNKLSALGICDSLCLLYKSILEWKYQYVEHKKTRFLSYTVKCGVAQGSNLDPLLFNIYINNVSK